MSDTGPPDGAALVIDVDGFEGPLDLLLTLARTQKVDLRRISVLALAEQYLSFIAEARTLRIELAADYLVMAAWLAYLKSRLLLPLEPGAAEPEAAAMAEALAIRLERLQAMRDAGARLMARDLLGRDVFARGAPEVVTHATRTTFTASLLDLMQAYARIRTRDEFRPWAFDRRDVYTMEEALDRLRAMVGAIADWTPLEVWLPEGWATPARRRSATAATFAAALELARQGRIALRQEAPFAPLSIRTRAP
jgi:segregation and condensation protein A